MKKMNEKQIDEINNNLEEIWHRLDIIAHFIQEIGTYGIIGNEIEESLTAIARALNKDYDKKLKELEESIGAKV